MSIFANGEKIGDVGSNATGTFTVEETPLGRTTIDSGVNPASTRPITQVTFSARDLATGALSAGVAAILVKDITTYLDVAPCAPSSEGSVSVSPCVSVTSVNVSVPGGTNGGSQGQACTFSLSESSQSFTATGGIGNVTVDTTSGCSWTATSSESFLTIVNGASGTGTGVVVFQVAPNTTGLARTATLTIGSQTFTVNQSI